MQRVMSVLFVGLSLLMPALGSSSKAAAQMDRIEIRDVMRLLICEIAKAEKEIEDAQGLIPKAEVTLSLTDTYHLKEGAGADILKAVGVKVGGHTNVYEKDNHKIRLKLTSPYEIEEEEFEENRDHGGDKTGDCKGILSDYIRLMKHEMTDAVSLGSGYQ